ncbi:MAG: hypothetical protein HUU28_18115, partial [Planctomycetaceae bacterium]|nr:hypothetical protein [Planctomycetaceae bacterium]
MGPEHRGFVGQPERREQLDLRAIVVHDGLGEVEARGTLGLFGLQHFERDFATPDHPVRLIKLEQNYRSHGTILDAANALI